MDKNEEKQTLIVRYFAFYFSLEMNLLEKKEIYFMASTAAKKASLVSSPLGRMYCAGKMNPYRPVSLNSKA